MKSYIKAFKNYARFSGRTSRKDFWMFFLLYYLIMAILTFVETMLGFYHYDPSIDYVGVGYLSAIYRLVWLCPFVAVQVRRLHDIGRSGHWIWISLIPFGGLYLMYLYIKRGDSETNKYGSTYEIIEKVSLADDPYLRDPYKKQPKLIEAEIKTDTDDDAELKQASEELLKFMLFNADPNRKAAIYNGQKPEDDDYGYTPTNPICTDSITDSPKYLSMLRTSLGEELDWIRTGSINLKELHGEQNVNVDIYTLYLHGEYNNKIYVCPYGKNSSFVPKGLQLSESPDPRIYGGDIEKEARDLQANVEDVLEYRKKQHEDGLLRNQEEFYFIKEMAENIQQSIPEKSIHNESLFCRKCGTPIPTDSIFCYKCGEKVSYK